MLIAGIGEVVAPVPVRHRGAKYVSGKKWARWEFKNVFVSVCCIRRISQTCRVHRVAEHFDYFPIFGNHCHRIPLIGIDPDIFLAIEGYAVAAFENRMSDKDIAETQRVCRECGIAADRTLEVSMPIEFNLPKRSPSSIDIEKIALLIEG